MAEAGDILWELDQAASDWDALPEWAKPLTSVPDHAGRRDEVEWLDCTCGHPNDDHHLGECPFPGCGCGAAAPADDASSRGQKDGSC